MPRPDKLTGRCLMDETKGPPTRNSRSRRSSHVSRTSGMSDKQPRRSLTVMLRDRICSFSRTNQPDARLPKHAPSLQTCFIAVSRHLSRQANRLGIRRCEVHVSNIKALKLLVRPVRHFPDFASRRVQGRMAGARRRG